MGLTITNRLTAKQKELLKRLGYYGNLNLTVQEAGDLIDDLIEAQADDNDMDWHEWMEERGL